MDSKRKILIIEDEESIRHFISMILTTNHYEAMQAKNGAEGMMLATSHCPDLILLDLGLPDADGQKMIQQVREWSSVPILVVSARTHERDKVAALDAGADDYITKPFGTSELLARVRTALRHADGENHIHAASVGRFQSGELVIDYDKHRVYLGESDVKLTQNEYKIVTLLAKYAGKVLTYEHIIKAIWGPNISGDNQILRVNMANIRRKIEKNPAAPHYIFTEIGVGYCMTEAD